MALVVNDRVKETSVTTGTGTLTLDGAASGFETFSTAIGNTNTTYYAISNRDVPAEFEVGLGTVAAGTLSRDTILSSSNSDAAVNFSAGTKDVFCTLPASKSVILDSSGNIVANNGSNLTNLNADNLASGTVPDARFPATLPAISGANLTNLDASDLASGTVPIARIDLDLLTTSTADTDGDFFVVVDSAGAEKKLTKGNINISGFNNDAGYTSNTGDITGVTAGSGLTGGGASGAVTLNVGAGTGIDVTADAIAVDVSDFMTNGSNNRVVTATGTDGQNAEANLTFDGSTLNVSGSLSVLRNNPTDDTLIQTALIGLSNTNMGQIEFKSGRDDGAFTNRYSSIQAWSNSLASARDLILEPDGGNVGIGNASPTEKLDVNGNVNIDGNIDDVTDIYLEDQIIHVGDTNTYLQFHAADQFRVVTGGSERLEVNNSNVTVNNADLDVNGDLVADKAYVAETTLTDGATISWNMSTQSVAKVTLGGNRTIAAPTNGSSGQFASILVIQDGTGSRTLTWNAVYEFASDTAPTLSTDGGKADLFVFRYNGTKWLEVGRNLLLTVS